MVRRAEHIGHGDAPKKADHLSLSLIPDVVHFAAIENRAIVVLPLDTLVQPERSLDGLDDVEKGDGLGRPRQRLATMRALLGFQDTAIRQERKDLRKNGLRNVLRFGDLAYPTVAARERCVRGR